MIRKALLWVDDHVPVLLVVAYGLAAYQLGRWRERQGAGT